MRSVGGVGVGLLRGRVVFLRIGGFFCFGGFVGAIEVSGVVERFCVVGCFGAGSSSRVSGFVGVVVERLAIGGRGAATDATGRLDAAV